MQNRFIQAEQELGLNKQSFEAKFVYSQQQNSSEEAYLLPLFKPLPSQLAGFSPQDIRIVHALAAEMISKAGQSLEVPVSTTVLAQCLFHFFYAKLPFNHYDIRDTMLGAMYLACKSEQTPKQRYEIIEVFDYIFKLYEGTNKNIRPIEVKCLEYQHMRNNTITKVELDILFQLGFQVYRLLDLPHRYIGALLSLFQRHPKYREFSKRAWAIINDCYLTTICLYFPSQTIAAAAVHIAMKEVKASHPQAPWWSLMETFYEAIEYIQMEIKCLRNCQGMVSFSTVSQRINEVSENHHGLQNVFPVPYYRKIMLENRGKLKIDKSAPQKIDIEEPFQEVEKKQPEITPQPKIDPSEKVEKEDNKTAKDAIPKGSLLQNISKVLQKHDVKMEDIKKKQKRQRVIASDDEEEDEDLRTLKQLRKKVKANRQNKGQ